MQEQHCPCFPPSTASNCPHEKIHRETHLHEDQLYRNQKSPREPKRRKGVGVGRGGGGCQCTTRRRTIIEAGVTERKSWGPVTAGVRHRGLGRVEREGGDAPDVDSMSTFSCAWGLHSLILGRSLGERGGSTSRLSYPPSLPLQSVQLPPS